jgi:methyl-accepting chemotaxis protein
LAAEYIDRISKGDIPPKVTDEYKGDFNEIKNNLNGCIDAINGLLKEAESLIYAVEEGRLAVRGNAAAYTGVGQTGRRHERFNRGCGRPD